MKKILSLIALFSFGTYFSTHAGTLIGWDLPVSTATNSVAPITPLANGVVGGNMSGSTARDTTSTARWQFKNFKYTNYADAFASNTSIAFQLGAASGYNLTINGVGVATHYRSGSGPGSIRFIFSTNSDFSTYSTIGNFDYGTNSGSTNLAPYWTSLLSNSPVSIPAGATGYFRFVLYGTTNTNGTGGFGAGNVSPAADFSLLGDAISSNPSFNWTGGSGAWASGVAANWQSGGVSAAWSNNQDAVFANGGDLTVDAAGVTAKAISVSGSSPVSLSGGAVNFTNLTMLAGSSLTLGGSSTYTASAGVDLTDASLSSGQLSAVAYTVNVSSGSKNISTALIGSAAFAKSGAGELVLSGANGYSGITSISEIGRAHV